MRVQSPEKRKLLLTHPTYESKLRQASKADTKGAKKAIKRSEIPPVPTTRAQADYYQNGLQLPRSPENLSKLLADIQRAGYFDNELNYILRRKEALADIEARLRRRIALPNRIRADVEGMGTDPMIEKSRTQEGLFGRAFRRILHEEISR